MILCPLRLRTLLPAIAAVATLACGGAPDAGSIPIAEIAGRSISLAEFQPILERTLEVGDSSDAVKSRLLDQFLEERVLLEEVRRRQIQVEEHEIDLVLDGMGDVDDSKRFRQEVRATLSIQRLLSGILEQASAVTPEAEEAYYREHPAEFQQAARVIVRQILLDAAAVADEVHALLARDPARFAAIAAERSTSADHGGRLTYAFDALPTEVGAALDGLPAGSLSPVIEAAGHYWIFLVEEVLAKRRLRLDEARPAIRERLQQERGDGAMARLVADLKRGMGLRLHRENLPFRYVEEEPA